MRCNHPERGAVTGGLCDGFAYTFRSEHSLPPYRIFTASCESCQTIFTVTEMPGDRGWSYLWERGAIPELPGRHLRTFGQWWVEKRFSIVDLALINLGIALGSALWRSW